jgi:pimeloyl-ACP methyl ester carboxylesterase
MFRNLIPMLADKYRVIAPDYPAFGHSAVPSPAEFQYTHAHLSQMMEALLEELGITRFAMYVMDFGGPIGYRLMLKHPDRGANTRLPAAGDAGLTWGTQQTSPRGRHRVSTIEGVIHHACNPKTS